MHQSVRDNLEKYLRGRHFQVAPPPEMAAHLAACEECQRELAAHERQSALLQTLRPGSEMQPRAGFYARVLNRIETQGAVSVWSTFLESAFRKRIIYASAALVLLVAGYVVSTEPGPHAVVPPSTFAMQQEPFNVPAALDGQYAVRDTRVVTPEQEQDAVLVNLVSFQE